MGRHAAPAEHSGSIRVRAIVLGMVTAVLAAMLPGLFFAQAQAADPDKVASTLEGCRFEAGQVLPQTSGPYNGKFICDASRPALRASGGTTKINISRTKTSETPADIPASRMLPV